MQHPLVHLLAEHHIHEVECVIPDMTGIARGKILPKDLFLKAGEMRLPKSVLLNTVNGQQPDNGPFVGDTDPDMVCKPDIGTFRVVPWAAEPVAVVIHDCQEWDGTPVGLSPRAVLRKIIALYTERGWRPVVAPEMEFYLVARQQNPHEPLHPPIGRTGKPEAGRQSYSIDAVNDFDPFFMELSGFCDVHRLGVETLIHEAGAGQMEINFSHGDPLELADRVFLFKRTVRETALRHGIFATFMAKPMEMEPGSAMHIHQSILDTDGNNLFSLPNGEASPAFFHCIAGLQTYLPQVMPMLAPYVNSYGPHQCALGLRQPHLWHPRAAVGVGGAPRGKPGSGCGRQPLPGDCRHAGLQLPGAVRAASTLKPAGQQCLGHGRRIATPSGRRHCPAARLCAGA